MMTRYPSGRPNFMPAVIRVGITAAVLGSVMLLGACAETRYVEGATESDSASLHTVRTVRYDLRDAYLAQAPECVAVLPLEAAAGTPDETANFIEAAAARHLSQRVARVIGPRERAHWSRRLAVDLSHPGDRNRFLSATGCDAFLRPTLMADDDFYLVVWSRRSIDLRLHVMRPANPAVAGDGKEETLWIARHAASRGDGGLPISPVSAGIAAMEAGGHQSDHDIQPSLIEDAIRRMIVTLPDTRGPAGQSSGYAFGQSADTSLNAGLGAGAAAQYAQPVKRRHP